MKNPSSYRQQISSRTRWHYLRGLLIRWWQHQKYACIRAVARRRGAIVGEAVVMPFSLARKANPNLIVGDHTSIQTDLLDLRNPIHIGSHVIIGAYTELLTTSHDIDSPEFDVKPYGLTIEDYVWLPMHVLVLPSCRLLGRGAVVGSGSVIVSNVEPMTVVGGNPAQLIRRRKEVHYNLVVESLLGGDYRAYREARKK